MSDENRKELEISNIPQYHNAGITGKGWRFTTLELLGKDERHAEMTIETYKLAMPDAEFVECPDKNKWTSTHIMQTVQWCIDNNIKTILWSQIIGIDEEQMDRYNKAFAYGKQHGVFAANAAGNDNKDMTGRKNICTIDELDIISAIWLEDDKVDVFMKRYKSVLKAIERASYSNKGKPIDYADFSHLMSVIKSWYIDGTSFSAPFFQGKRDLLRYYLESKGYPADYKTVMSIIDSNLIDLGEVGEDDLYGKGLFILPDLNTFKIEGENMKVKEFIEKLKNVLNYKTVYMWGVFGSPVTNKIISEKTKQYTGYYTLEEVSKLEKLVDKGYFAFDCVNLIKGILWGWNGDNTQYNGGATYLANGVKDVSANGMMNLLINPSTDFSNIEVGEAVWMDGHIGVYIGEGKVIECTPSWANGVQVTACGNIGKMAGLNTRTWTKHGKIPYIDYTKEVIETKPKQIEIDINILVSKGIINSPDYWKAGNYSTENVQTLIHKFATYINK